MDFDLEKALSGNYKIKTKNGINVRLICTDRKGDLSIVALIEEEYKDSITERVQSYYNNGKCKLYFPSDLDLVLEEIKE